MLGIKLDCAQSVLAAICSHIVSECYVVQNAAFLYWCEKVFDISTTTMKKNSSYGKSLNQFNTSVQ